MDEEADCAEVALMIGFGTAEAFLAAGIAEAVAAEALEASPLDVASNLESMFDCAVTDCGLHVWSLGKRCAGQNC